MSTQFPDSPSNGDVVVINGYTYVYDSTKDRWSVKKGINKFLASLKNYIVTDVDPTTDYNPGTTDTWWLNKDTNILYKCYDASTDDNKWRGLEFTIDIAPAYTNYGQSYAYLAGEYDYGGTDLDKISFTSDGNATAVSGGVGHATTFGAGGQSGENSYLLGGYSDQSRIDRMPFANEGGYTDIGTLAFNAYTNCATSHAEKTYSIGDASRNTGIQSVPFANDTASSDIGNIFTYSHSYQAASASTLDYGYVACGNSSENNRAEKFAVASDTASYIGTTLRVRRYTIGTNSQTYGYIQGSYNPGRYAQIEKFPFADATISAADIGNLIYARGQLEGASSETHGYVMNGYPRVDYIEKYPFASDTNATDIGNLTRAKRLGIATQV
jgi:hypothetical protein